MSRGSKGRGGHRAVRHHGRAYRRDWRCQFFVTVKALRRQHRVSTWHILRSPHIVNPNGGRLWRA